MQITITNTKIIDFFNNNQSSINPEAFLLQSIDFYEYVSSSINDNNSAQLLPYILSQSNLIQQLLTKSNKMEENLEIVKDNKNLLMNQVSQLRNDNVNSIKDVQNLILQNNVDYTNKTKDILNEMLQNINTSHDYKEIINNFDKRLIENNNYLMTITKETIMTLNSSNNKDIQSLTKDIEIITNKSFNDIKGFIEHIQQNSPKEFETYFDKIKNELKNYSNEFQKNDSLIVKNIQDTISPNFQQLHKNISEISNIFIHKNSSNKGKVSENVLETLLSKKFPTYIIQRTSSDFYSGDFILTTDNKPDILVENKDYERNIPIDEINKFIRDISQNNISGIFISQNSGISTKDHFQIDFINDNVLIYIHNCNYDLDTIYTAVHIIYSLTLFIQQNKQPESNNLIDKNTLQNIHTEYISFIKQRNDIINSLQTSIKNIKKLDLLSIKNIISKFDNTLQNISHDIFPCSLCDRTFLNKNSLSAHKKAHTNQLKKSQDENSSQNSQDQPLDIL